MIISQSAGLFCKVLEEGVIAGDELLECFPFDVIVQIMFEVFNRFWFRDFLDLDTSDAET